MRSESAPPSGVVKEPLLRLQEALRKYVLQVIANVMPAKHFIIILRGIMLKGVGLEVLWPQTLILVGMTLFLLAVSIREFKVRLQ